MFFLAGMCGHKLNLTAKIREAIFPRLVHEIMSFVTRPRSQPMSVFVANEYIELTQMPDRNSATGFKSPC